MAVIAVTVLLSVLAHGVSAAPLAARYGRAAAAREARSRAAPFPTCPSAGCRGARDAGHWYMVVGDGPAGRG